MEDSFDPQVVTAFLTLLEYEDELLANGELIRTTINNLDLCEEERKTITEQILTRQRKGDQTNSDSRAGNIHNQLKKKPSFYTAVKKMLSTQNAIPTAAASTPVPNSIADYNAHVLEALCKSRAIFTNNGNPDFSTLLEKAAVAFLRDVYDDTTIARKTERLSAPDGGIDVVGESAVGQCKFTQKVGVDHIRSFLGALSQEQRNIHFFGQNYTTDAVKHALSNNVKLNVCKLFGCSHGIGMFVMPFSKTQ